MIVLAAISFSTATLLASGKGSVAFGTLRFSLSSAPRRSVVPSGDSELDLES
jgi:hypothetical protein